MIYLNLLGIRPHMKFCRDAERENRVPASEKHRLARHKATRG